MSTSLFVASAIEFTVYGTPRPQGSMRSFWKPGMVRAVITSDNSKLKPWRQQITEMALSLNAMKIEVGPVRVELDFYFSRPKSAAKRIGMTVKPDIDKLTRAIFDSITGVLIRDDSQITHMNVRKHYGDPERVVVRVEEI